jgi:hypothetical protein
MNTQPQWLFEVPLAHETPGGQLSPPQLCHRDVRYKESVYLAYICYILDKRDKPAAAL